MKLLIAQTWAVQKWTLQLRFTRRTNQFSAALGIDIETAAAGIEIPEMIRLIEEKKEPALGVLESGAQFS